MSVNYDDSKLPKSVYYHSPDWIQNMQMFMGINNSTQGFDHFFLQCENFTKFMWEVIEAIKQGAIKTTIPLDNDAISKLNYIWEGPLWLEVRRGGLLSEKVIERKLHYGKKPELKDQADEIIPLPSLQDMDPVSGIKENRMLVRIRAKVQVKYGMRGLDVAQLVTGGKMHYNFKFGQEPIFEEDADILNSEAYSMLVGRPYFHNTVNILKKAFLKYFTIVYINFHRIITEKMTSFNTNENDSDYISQWEE
jgi:hypothetical protein